MQRKYLILRDMIYNVGTNKFNIYFNYENCVISVATLVILSLIFYDIKYFKKKPEFGICLNEFKKYLNYFKLIFIFYL